MAEQAAREALRDLAGGTPPAGESHAGAEQGAPTPPIAQAARRPGPRAEVSVRRQPDAGGSGGLARVRVEVELDYPCDLAGHCGAIRRRVTERLSDLAGMEVPGVALVVARLHSAHRRTGRVG
ncbi:hypothetical protein LZF96_19355 [Streptomyces sp. ST2-7A]|nr:hypothetical protein [Streptomyces sp. ST2-7A]